MHWGPTTIRIPPSHSDVDVPRTGRHREPVAPARHVYCAIQSGFLPALKGQVSAGLPDEKYEDLATVCKDWATTIMDARRRIVETIEATTFTDASAEASIAANVSAVLDAVDVAAHTAIDDLTAVEARLADVDRGLRPILEANPTTFNARIIEPGGVWNFHKAPEFLPGFPDAKPVKY